MKRKLILLILILLLGFLAWRLFVATFSQEPIEIIVEDKEEVTPEILDDTLEASTDDTIEASIDTSAQTKETTTAPPKEEPARLTSSDFIINKKVSWGYSSSNDRTIDTVVVHSSYDALGSKPYDLDGLIDEYKQYGVAPHFLIDRKGNVYRLVDEKNIAYHAGVSKMPDGRTGANNFSIGIEMMNTKEDNYTDKQYSGLNDLIDYLESQYKIKYVLGHEDISPDRKTDPWNFDWKEVNSNNAIH